MYDGKDNNPWIDNNAHCQTLNNGMNPTQAKKPRLKGRYAIPITNPDIICNFFMTFSIHI